MGERKDTRERIKTMHAMIEGLLPRVGRVDKLPDSSGIVMALPDEQDSESGSVITSKIVFRLDRKSRKLILNKVKSVGKELIVSEPSDLEVVVFARKAIEDLEDHPYTKGLSVRSAFATKNLMDGFKKS